VSIEDSTSGTGIRSKFYMYAPNASCAPGTEVDDPSTSGIDESDARGNDQYIGSFVCAEVVLDSTYSLENHAPFAELVEFGAAGFGSDLYPANLWFLNREATEHVARQEW
jgi:hypothetical protein